MTLSIFHYTDKHTKHERKKERKKEYPKVATVKSYDIYSCTTRMILRIFFSSSSRKEEEFDVVSYFGRSDGQCRRNLAYS